MVWGPLYAYLFISVCSGSFLKGLDSCMVQETLIADGSASEALQTHVQHMEMDTGLCTVHEDAPN